MGHIRQLKKKAIVNITNGTSICIKYAKLQEYILNNSNIREYLKLLNLNEELQFILEREMYF